MSTGYITFPIEVDSEDVLNDAITYLQSKFPNWKAVDPNLDIAMLQAWSTEAAQLRELASSVPDAIFRTFGSSLMSLPPIDAAPATAQTTWTMVDNSGYTIKAGTLVGIPLSGVLIPFQVQADVVVLAGATVTATGGVTIVALNDGADGTGLGSIGGTVTLIDALAFVSGITQVAVTTGGVDAEDNPTYFARLRAQLALMAPRLIIPSDFATAAKSKGAYRAVAVDGFNPFHNLLTANEASAETDASGWSSKANTTVASTSAQAADGTKSVSMTAIAAADMNIHNAASYLCSPGETMTAIGFFRSAVTARACKMGLEWRDSGDSIISTTYGSTVNDTTSGFTEAFVTAAAPATAAKVRVVAFVTAPVISEVHYADKLGLRRGSTTDWVAGGTADSNNTRMVAVAVVDSAGAALGSTPKATIDAYEQAQREVNFVVNIIDPNFISIDIAATVVALSGYDHTALDTAITNALTSYISPASWGIDPASRDSSSVTTWVNNATLRFQDISAIVNGIEGVDHWTTLTINITGMTPGTADVTLPGAAPLTTPGTVAVTVSP